VTLTVAPGIVFGLLGPNGAGKTTIFKILSTLVLPDDGSAIVTGLDVVRHAAAVRRAIAVVPPEERSLHWRLSARENLQLFAALHRLPAEDTGARVREALRTVGLDDAGRTLVGEFSSGMRQRLLVARALLSRPRVLLLDEPTRTLDPVSACELRHFLRTELVRERGCTIALATHNAEEAFDFCDRVAVLHRGRILATGKAAGLAASLGGERYRIVTSNPEHAGWKSLEWRGLIARVGPGVAVDDRWTAIDCAVEGGPSRAAMVLRGLVDSGIEISRFERVELSLADLVRRIIGASPKDLGAGERTDHA
jgi:ABC-2 type transport system ATP-binding protein